MKKLDNVIVFTDGSCMNKSDGIKAGYGVYFPNEELNNISKPFTFGDKTNQRAELYAIYKAIKRIILKFEFNQINIYTDSNYSIQSLTKWIKTWKKNNWKNSKKQNVANQDIIKKIDDYLQQYPNKILFHHVKSHTKKDDFNSKGNEMADKLATEGALCLIP
jgi:ribonuclease HI